MRITKFGHACVRIDHAGTTLVLADTTTSRERDLMPGNSQRKGAIARKGVPAPIQAGSRWVVERAHSWMNGYGKLRRCTETRAAIPPAGSVDVSRQDELTSRRRVRDVDWDRRTARQHQ